MTAKECNDSDYKLISGSYSHDCQQSWVMTWWVSAKEKQGLHTRAPARKTMAHHRSTQEHWGALRNRLIDEKLGGSGLPQVAALGKYVSSTTSLGSMVGIIGCSSRVYPGTFVLSVARGRACGLAANSFVGAIMRQYASLVLCGRSLYGISLTWSISNVTYSLIK